MRGMVDERNPLWARVDAVVAAGLVANERQWLLDAKLSTGFFSSKRAEEKKKGRHIGLQADNLQRLAAVAGVNPSWLQNGTGSMRAGGDPEVQEGPDPLISIIAAIEPQALRLALADFYSVHRDREARSTCDEFVTRAYKKGEREKGKADWAREIRVAYEARKNVYAHPFGVGAQKI